MDKIKIVPLPDMTAAFRMMKMHDRMQADLVRVTGIDHAGLGMDRTAYTETYLDAALHGVGYVRVTGISHVSVGRDEVIAQREDDK